MSRVGRSGCAIAKPSLKLRNAPPPYVKPLNATVHKPVVVYGNIGSWDAFRLWLASRPYGGVIVLRGPPGVGKTHTTHLMAASLQYAVMELNASFGESADAFAAILHEASLVGRINGRRRLILVDELDSLSVDIQLIVLEHVRSLDSRFAPLVCTCNDFASATVRSISSLATKSLELRAVSESELRKYVNRYYPTRLERTVYHAVASAKGDIRQLDIRLRVADAAKPDAHSNVFDLARALITRRSPSQWLDDASVGKDSRLVLYLAHENYTSAVPSLSAMAEAADVYSVAECMLSSKVIGALDDVVSVLGASGPSLSVCKWTMCNDSKIRWPELLRASKTKP